MVHAVFGVFGLTEPPALPPPAPFELVAELPAAALFFDAATGAAAGAFDTELALAFAALGLGSCLATSSGRFALPVPWDEPPLAAAARCAADGGGAGAATYRETSDGERCGLPVAPILTYAACLPPGSSKS